MKLIITFILLNIFFLIIRIPDLSRPLWNDEIISIKTTQTNPIINPLYDGVSTNLPLFYYFLKIGNLFGLEAGELRIISLLASILVLNLVLYLFYKTRNNLWLILAILTTFSPIQIYYSVELRTYMLTQLILFGIFILISNLINKEKVNYYFLSSLIFLSLISHYTAYIFIGSLILFFLIFRRDLINEKLVKSFVIPILISLLIFVSISNNLGFADSTKESILNQNFERISPSHLTENILRTNEVLTIYYNYGLHYYRLDGFFISVFKKFMYIVLLVGAFFLIKKNARPFSENISFILLSFCLLIAIIFDLIGFIAFGGRYLFPFHFLYLIFISEIISNLAKLNKYVALITLALIITAYNLYNSCLITNLEVYKGNEDPQGVLIQNCFK